jgi:Mu-like prophage protein Com.
MRMKTDTAHDSGNVRCGNCDKLLAKGCMELGEIEFLCPRCKSRTVLRATRPNLAPQDGLYGDRYARTEFSPHS